MRIRILLRLNEKSLEDLKRIDECKERNIKLIISVDNELRVYKENKGGDVILIASFDLVEPQPINEAFYTFEVVSISKNNFIVDLAS